MPPFLSTNSIEFGESNRLSVRSINTTYYSPLKDFILPFGTAEKSQIGKACQTCQKQIKKSKEKNIA